MVMGLSKTSPTACVEGSRIHNVPPVGVLSYPVAKVEKGAKNSPEKGTKPRLFDWKRQFSSGYKKDMITASSVAGPVGYAIDSRLHHTRRPVRQCAMFQTTRSASQEHRTGLDLRSPSRP